MATDFFSGPMRWLEAAASMSPSLWFAPDSEFRFPALPGRGAPDFSLDSIQVATGQRVDEIAVHEEVVYLAPFARLLHFRKEGILGQPPLLIVAPLSGHYASRLRDTVRTALPDHDVYITDWLNARDVPLAAGRFGLEEYGSYLMACLKQIGAGVNVLAICQACPPALAMASLMAEDDDPSQPRTLTLMAGPIDTRINPTQMQEIAARTPLDFVEKKFTTTVPAYLPGAMRQVYPGYLQLATLMNSTPGIHMEWVGKWCEGLLAADFDKTAQVRSFYQDYLAVQDLAAEFYLDTLRMIFQNHCLPQGDYRWKGRTVDPKALRGIPLLTIEGRNDTVSSPGQTRAAHQLSGRPSKSGKRVHLEVPAGHDEIFNGPQWTERIYPDIRTHIHSRQ